jgi:hypothetical protein
MAAVIFFVVSSFQLRRPSSRSLRYGAEKPHLVATARKLSPALVLIARMVSPTAIGSGTLPVPLHFGQVFEFFICPDCKPSEVYMSSPIYSRPFMPTRGIHRLTTRSTSGSRQQKMTANVISAVSAVGM